MRYIRMLEAHCRKLEKRAASDAALIESLNRYIEALEGRDAQRAELMQELKKELSAIRAMLGNQNEPTQ